MPTEHERNALKNRYLRECTDALAQGDYGKSFSKLNAVERVFGVSAYTSRIRSSLMRDAFLNLPAEDFNAMFPMEGSPRVCLIGDSHVRSLFLEYDTFQRGFRITPVLLAISGASISGLRRDTSTLGLNKKLRTYLELAHPDVLVFKFGQVDVDLGYFYRRVVKDMSLDFEEFAATLIRHYMEQVSSFTSAYPCIVCSINLPCLFIHDHATTIVGNAITESVSDASLKNAYIRKLHGILPDIRERTKMTMALNAMLSAECVKLSVPFIDYTDIFIDKSTLLLKERYTQTDDVHYATDHNDRAFCIDMLMHEISGCIAATRNRNS